jgi:hypothetical protein
MQVGGLVNGRGGPPSASHHDTSCSSRIMGNKHHLHTNTQILTVTFGSKKTLSVIAIPRISSVRNSVWEDSSNTPAMSFGASLCEVMNSRRPIF